MQYDFHIANSPGSSGLCLFEKINNKKTIFSKKLNSVEKNS